jgi:voltage-gated potassium channel
MKKLKYFLIPVGILTIMLVFNVTLVYFEKQSDHSSITSLSKAFWYMTVTLTTVGYGDYTPITTGGKIIGYLYVLCSLGVIGYLISMATNTIFTIMEEKKLGHRGTDFSDHILIIGWNEFSRMVVEEIDITDKNMAIITNNKDDIDMIYTQFGTDNIFVLFSDYSNFEMLDKVNANKASVAFISLEDDSEALMYVLDFNKFYPRPSIVVSLQKPRLKDTFHAAGVTYAVARNEIASKLVASYIFEPDVAEMNLELISTSKSDTQHDIQEFLVTDSNPYLDKFYLDTFTDLKKDFNSILIGIHKISEKKTYTNPAQDMKIEKNDYLIVLSSGSSKRKLQSSFGVEEGRLSN